MGERKKAGATDEADCDCSLGGDTPGAAVLLCARLKGVGLFEFPEVALPMLLFPSPLLELLFAAMAVAIGVAFAATPPETGIGMSSGDGGGYKLSGAAAVFNFSADRAASAAVIFVAADSDV